VVAQGKVFVPASLSTSGGFGPKFKQYFGDLVKHSADYKNIPAAALTHYWLRRFSVIVSLNTWVVLMLVLSVTRVEMLKSSLSSHT
jgi:formate hydrogenlyase subunit 4